MMIFNVMGRHCVTHSAPGRHDSPKIQVGSHTHSLARIIRKWEKLTLGKWLLIAFYLQHFCLVAMYLLKWTVCQPVYFLENIRQVLENVSILRPEWSYYLPISLAIIISICCNFLILIAENCETFIAALRVAILTFKCSYMLCWESLYYCSPWCLHIFLSLSYSRQTATLGIYLSFHFGFSKY